MRVIKSNLSPGRSSCATIEDVAGSVVIELTADDLADLKYTADYVIDLANQELAAECGDDIEVTWNLSVDGRFATLAVSSIVE